MQRVSAIFASFLVFAAQANLENGKNSVESDFEFINQLQSELKLTDNQKITLALGNTGSGKSTLVHFVAGDYSKLIALEPDFKVSSDYQIYDGLDTGLDNNTSTTVSRTTVPEMVEDEFGNVWYDCPGFADTRSEVVELATTFLIKKVLDNASNVKVVLVVNQGSLAKGYDRVDFDKLLTHATQLITKIDRYKDSVSMVLTKTLSQKIMNEKIVNVPPDSIKEEAAEYMREHRRFLLEKGSSEEKIKLIDALMDQAADKTYHKLTIFWRPNDAGPFNTIPLMVSDRETIRKCVFEEAAYTAVGANDFGFSLSDTTKLYIEDMAQYIEESVSEILRDMDNEVLLAIQHKLDTFDDFNDRLEVLSAGRKSVLTKTTSFQDLKQRFSDLNQIFNLTVVDLQTNFSRIDQDMNNLNILTTVSPTSVKTFSLGSLVAATVRTTDYITAEYHWYTFLEHVSDFLASYEVQTNIEAYNVADLRDWRQSNKRQGLHIDANNFDDFTEKFPGRYELTPSGPRLAILNEIIKITLQSPTKYECTNDSIIVQGNIVRSSQIEKSGCPLKEFPKIKVLAVTTFFVDSDLNLDEHDLIIFADQWIIVKPSTFNLNGASGGAPSRSNTPEGGPGNSGTSAGNFFGFANKIFNGDALTVKLNGGNGGKGQDGVPQNDATVTINPKIKKGTLTGPYTSTKQYYLHLLREGGYRVEVVSEESYWKIYGQQFKNFYNIFPATCCGKTGSGGPGGLGASAGSYKFIQKDASPTPKFTLHQGSEGGRGEDASVCHSFGYYVGYVTTEVSGVVQDPVRTLADIWEPKQIPNDQCPDAYVQTNKKPASPSPHKALEFTSAVIEYKTFLRNNMAFFPNLGAIQKTYAAIDSEPNITSTYTLYDMAVELNSLEKQYYDLKDHVDLLPFYDHFLEWIENFAVANKEQNSESDRKVIRLLYTTTLSKLMSMRSGQETDLIIDIRSFFDLINKNINELDDIGRINMIHQYRDEYNETLTAKIDEATNFIENEVQPEIEKIFSAIDKNMEGVVAETVQLEDKTKREIELKKENLQQLRQNMILRIITGVFDMSADCIGLAGPEGKVAAAIIKTGTAIVNGAITDPPTNKLVMPEGVVNMRKRVAEMLKKQGQQKVDAISKEMEKLQQALEGKDIDIHVLEDLLRETKSIDVENSNSEILIKDVSGRFTDLVTGFKNTVKAMEKVKDKKELLEQLNHSAEALAVIQSSISVFVKFAGDDNKIAVLANAIIEDQQTLAALKMLELQIQSELIPMLNGLQDSLDDVESKMANKSPVSLDVQQWKIHNTLRSVQAKLLESISGFKNEFGIRDCFTKLEEAFNLVIKIFDRVDNYQEQSRFAEYLTDLQTADIRNLVIDDQRLENEVGDLRFNLQMNIVLSQYNRAIDAFKQVVFPFADEFVEIYPLPASIIAGKNLVDVVSVAAGKVNSLSKRIKEISATIRPEDAIITNSNFDRDHDWSKPFYVWKNNEVNDKIRQLFAGEKIYLLADVERSSNLNAVKFNVIDMAFYSGNQSTFDQLNQKLKSFRIAMTHMGESNYRCNQKFYTISSRSQEIRFSLGDKSYEPSSTNEVYEKLRNGDKMLSPYALWTIQLTDGQFKELEPFVDSVDIELRGRAQYINAGAAICNHNLGEFYSHKDVL